MRYVLQKVSGRRLLQGMQDFLLAEGLGLPDRQPDNCTHGGSHWMGRENCGHFDYRGLCRRFSL